MGHREERAWGEKDMGRKGHGEERALGGEGMGRGGERGGKKIMMEKLR